MLTTKDIWSNNLNRTEERKLIHQFWLELSEDERKSLILIEKEAVINKIKDQQKNTCNCSICGKTRHNVEYELEVLYDMYFKELESYSHSQRQKQIMMETDSDSDEYDEDDQDDDSDTDEPNLEVSVQTVKQNISTASDKSLKRGGQKLLSMMHKFAEKKRIREQEILEEDSDDDLQDESDGEGKTEAEKRRDAFKMFTIFAARMFEQRVLAAYREKVAQDRQKRLIEELEEEDRRKHERELKKQKEKEEKKNKKRLLKLQQEREREEEEERKRQEELALKQKQEEERQLREQERIKREQEKQKKEMERLQKENERRKKRLKEKEEERKRKEEEVERKRKEEEVERKRNEEEAERRRKQQEEAEKKREEEEKLLKKVEEASSQNITNENEPNVPSRHGFRHILTDQSNLSSTVNPKRQLPSVGPIGPPGKPSLAILPTNNGQHCSFFSTHVFDQPIHKRAFTDEESDNGILPKRQASSTYINGWAQLNALSEKLHGELFGDVIVNRHAMIIERTRVAYATLDRIAANISLQKPYYHSLSQIHRVISETYKDNITVGIRELYEAITTYSQQEFKCLMSEEQGYIVVYQKEELPTIPTQYPFF